MTPFNKLKSIIASLVVMLSLSACSAIGSKYEITKAELPENIPANSGLLIGSFPSAANDGGYVYNRGIRFSSLENKEISDSIANPYNLLGPEAGDSYFAFMLPAGNYEMHDLYMVGVGYGATLEWSNKQPFSIPFKVTQGQATYIGEIKNIPVVGENIFGLDIAAGGYFVISNQSAKDLPQLKQKFPFLNNSEIIVDVLKSGNVPPELIRFE